MEVVKSAVCLLKSARFSGNVYMGHAAGSHVMHSDWEKKPLCCWYQLKTAQLNKTED